MPRARFTPISSLRRDDKRLVMIHFGQAAPSTQLRASRRQLAATPYQGRLSRRNCRPAVIGDFSMPELKWRRHSNDTRPRPTCRRRRLQRPPTRADDIRASPTRYTYFSAYAVERHVVYDFAMRHIMTGDYFLVPRKRASKNARCADSLLYYAIGRHT